MKAGDVVTLIAHEPAHNLRAGMRGLVFQVTDAGVDVDFIVGGLCRVLASSLEVVK